MRLILPNTFVEIDYSYGPLFFLAGPVRGGGDWQAKCADLIHKKHFDQCYIAIPCRYEENHPHMRYRISGNETRFPRQLAWERYYLEKAAGMHGCLIFYLPLESKTHPHPGPEPYAMDTRGELGEWRWRARDKHSNHIVIGAEEGFFGLSQIEYNFSVALGRDFKAHRSLEATVEAACQVVTLSNFSNLLQKRPNQK